MVTRITLQYSVIFGGLMLAAFLMVAYQITIVTKPPVYQFIGKETTSHGPDRNRSDMLASDLLTSTTTLIFTSKKNVNPKDTAPYWPVFTNTSNGMPFKMDKWLVETEACNIFNYNPRDPTMIDIIKDNDKSFDCPSNTVSGPANVTGGLVYIKNGMLLVNEKVKRLVLEHYGTTESDFMCTVQYLKRFPVEENDWIIRTPDKATVFKNETKVLDEFMKILCYTNITTVVYETYDFAVLRKKDVEARCNFILKLLQYKGTFCKDQLSVLLMGVDSLSRMTSMRHLTKTRAILEKMGAIEFLGYNKIGPNTFPNMFGFLTGRLSEDLRNKCWKNDDVFDNCTFLWDMFAAAGYRTAFVENMEYFGLFNNLRNGFLRQPVDYYGRVFFQGAKNLLKQFKTGCLRNVSEDEAVFQWGVEFQKEFAGDRHFGYFWISMFSHDNFNNIQKIDPFLSKQLNTMYLEKTLNNTLLIVMGDHGPRYGKLMHTKIGKYESNLPPLFLVFPEWFQKKYPAEIQNVRVNARNRLVTHLDLHQTLKDIINCEVATPPDLVSMEPQRHQAVSLFRSISESRTCFEAGVDEKFCGCHKNEIKISTATNLTSFISKLVVEKLNNLTKPNRAMCAELSLNTTEEVRARLSGDKQKLSRKDSVTFVVTLNTSPGEGKFSAFVYHTKENGLFKVDDEIFRLNAYGNSSACIKDAPQLLPICLCIDHL